MVMRNIKRLPALVTASVLVLAGAVPILASGTASANSDYALLTSREIRMSSSAVGTIAAGQDVTYLVRATTPSTQSLGGMVIEFCSNTPIIGDSCTAPAGFSTNEAGLALANQTGITDWSIDAATDANTLVLTRTPASFTAGTFTLELGAGGASDGITNPSASNTSFYARIVTFAVNQGSQQYTDTDIDGAGNNTVYHAGGVALSTADQITIQAKVQERLTFCVYTSAINYADCTVSTTNPVVLGDATTGVLDPNTDYVSKATKYNVTTNASSGVTIRAKGTTLTSAGNTIDAIGATPATSTPGTEQFGFCTYRDTGGGNAGLTPNAKYNGDVGGGVDCADTAQGANGDGGADFAFDLSTACGATASAADFGENNLSCRYGDAIATKTAGNFSTGIISFLGNISNTTEPGIYTTTMTFVATGNY